MELSPDEYKQIKVIFNQAMELEPDRRRRFVTASGMPTDVQREVEKMLDAAENADTALERSAFAITDDDALPANIGEYKILGAIGHGGMGAVYSAVREGDGFVQKAAVKVIRNGMNNETILRRFRSEQKILANLEHPNIARFLDGGRTPDGMPFYAMEYIEGTSIDEYCRSENIGLEARLELFRKVCSAVSYAHSQLIVHRDLKPSNVLVTSDGVPKLLDFGIAKVLETGESGVGTATQLGMMTPQYASPEQVRGEKVSTLSDVYSLGVILYEIVTGSRPYSTDGKNYAEILAIVTRAEPVRPSASVVQARVRKRLKGDIDNIVLKALQKDPARRYASVEQLSDDLRRYNAGLPVSARSDTFGYRFQKFVMRNRIGAAAAGLLLITLFGGIGATVWQAVRAERQRVLAEKRFGEVRNLANNVVFKYHDEIAKLEGSTAVREMLVKDATAYLDNLSADAGNDPELQHEMGLAYLKLGDVQGKLYAANTGNTAAAFESYKKSIDLLERSAVTRPSDVAVRDDLLTAYDALSVLMARTLSKPEDKEALLEKAAAALLAVRTLEPDNPKRLSQLATIYIRYGDAVGSIGDRDSLVTKLDRHQMAVPLTRQTFDSDPNDPENMRLMARISQRIGTDYLWLGENAELNNDTAGAKAYFARALPYHQTMNEIIERVVRAVPDDRDNRRFQLASLSSYAETLARNEQKDKAIEIAGQCLKLANEGRRLDPTNREAMFDLSAVNEIFAKIYLFSNDYPRSVEYTQSALAMAEKIVDADEGNFEAFGKIGSYCDTLSRLYGQMGDKAQEAFYQKKLENNRTRVRQLSESK